MHPSLTPLLKRAGITALAVGVVAALVLAVPAQSASARSCLLPDADGILWQIGVEDGPNTGEARPAMAGALEYPDDGTNTTWVPVVEYNATGIDLMPDFPGYLDSEGHTRGASITTDAAGQAIINWEQCSKLDLVIEYGRYGSEDDMVTLDGELAPALTPAGESQYAQLTSESLALARGDHSLIITYVGGGADSGHFVDYLRAREACVKPANPTAVPDGYTFLSAERSPQTLTAEIPAGEWDLVASVGEFNCSLEPGTVVIDGYASIATSGVKGDAGIVEQVIGTVVGPDSLTFDVSTQDPISVGVRIEVQQP